MGVRETWGFGIARSHAVTAIQQRFGELCEILSRKVGCHFYPHHAVSYRDLIEATDRGDLGLAWMPPIGAIELSERGKLAPLVIPSRGGCTSFHSALIVRRGGPKSITELKGYRAAWVEKESAAGYVVPRMHLATKGIDPNHYFSQELVLHSHFAVVDAVVSGRVDVGATFCSLDPITKRVITAGWTAPDGTNLRPVDVLATFGPIPNDAVAAATKLPADVRARVTRFFLELESRERALLNDLVHATTFRVCAPAHFEPLRHIIRAARARGYNEPASTIPPPARS